MRIGRDHIASTVYTITFAYVGSALMTLIIVSAHDQSLFDTLTLGDMSVEVVSILVCSIGLVVAIPLTTGLGVLVVRSGLRPTRQTGSGNGSGSASAPDPDGDGARRREGGRPSTRREALLRSELRPGLREDAADDLLHLVEFALAHRQRRRELDDRVSAIIGTAVQAAFVPLRGHEVLEDPLGLLLGERLLG